MLVMQQSNKDLFINIILAFPDNYSNEYDNVDTDTCDNKIIVLKRVKSLRQLRRTEKELVRLCYIYFIVQIWQY